MADDTNPVPPKSQRLNVKSMNVTRQRVSDAQFTRADIETGEIKSLEGDILNDIKSAIDDQTKTLGKGFKRAIDDCCQAIVKAGGAGGGGGGDGVAARGSSEEHKKSIDALTKINDSIRAMATQVGGGEGGDAGTVAQTRRVQALSNAIEKLGFYTNEAGEETFKLVNELSKFEEQLRENVNETIREFNATLIKAMNSFTRIEQFTGEAMSRWNKGLDLASSGLADFNTLFLDDTLKLTGIFGSTGDSLLKTAETIRELSGDITSPMRLMQTGVEGVAMEFERLRDEAEEFGLDLYARVGFEEQNKLLMQMVDAQRRSTIMNDINNFEIRQRSMEQIKFLGILADNTGRSLEELVKSNTQTVKEFNELVTLGIISQDQADNFAAVAEAQPAMKDFLLKIAESGGNIAAFSAKNKDFFEQLVMTNNDHLVPMIASIMQNSEDGVAANNAVFDITKQSFENIGGKFGSVASSLLLQGTDVSKLAQAVAEETKLREEAGKKSPLIRTWNKVSDFFTNTWPVQWAKSLGALTFNTIAIIANTIAHWKGVGMMGGLWGGMKKMGGTLLRGMGFMRAGAAASAGMGAVSSMGGFTAVPGAIGAVGAGGAASAVGGGAAAGVGMMSKLSKFGPALKGLGKVAGGVGTAAMVGKDIYDVATGDTSGENIGALIGTALGGAIGLIGGPAGAIIGAGLGNIAGEWIGKQFDTPGAAKPTTPSYAPRRRDAGGVGGGQQVMAMHMMRQTDILNSINMRMERSIAIQRDIASGIGRIGSGVSAVEGTGASPLVADTLYADSPYEGRSKG